MLAEASGCGGTGGGEQPEADRQSRCELDPQWCHGAAWAVASVASSPAWVSVSVAMLPSGHVCRFCVGPGVSGGVGPGVGLGVDVGVELGFVWALALGLASVPRA